MFRSRYRNEWRIGHRPLVVGNEQSSVDQVTEYSFDFTVMADGALPAPLTGSTWAIYSGAVYNSVTVGTEKLTDPGLEANYTDGKCDTLNKVGLPTLEESADVHGGSKAQQFTAVAVSNEVYFPFTSLTAGSWYIGSAWAKRTATTNRNTKVRMARSGAKPTATLDRTIDQSAYTQYINVLRAESTGNSTIEIVNTDSTTFATVIADDASLKQITFSTMMASVEGGGADKIVRGAVGAVNGLVGLVARLDSVASPANFIIGYIYRSSTYYYATLEKCVAGTYTQLISPLIIDYDFSWVEGRQFEIRCSGTTVSLWYNSTQIGTDQTISDAGILSNTKFGMLSAGESDLQSFFVVAP